MADEKSGAEHTENHNKGQSDYNSGKYEPPHTIGILDGIIQPQHTWDKLVEDNKAYDEGYSNARKNK